MPATRRSENYPLPALSRPTQIRIGATAIRIRESDMYPCEDDSGQSVIPSHLIELGQQALAAVTTNVASGAPLVRCQLVASEFYEALKAELRATSDLGVVERMVVVAAANHCRQAATASISPGAMLVKIRNAVAVLQFRGPVAPAAGFRPMLRVIEGGLSQ